MSNILIYGTYGCSGQIFSMFDNRMSRIGRGTNRTLMDLPLVTVAGMKLSNLLPPLWKSNAMQKLLVKSVTGYPGWNVVTLPLLGFLAPFRR